MRLSLGVAAVCRLEARLRSGFLIYAALCVTSLKKALSPSGPLIVNTRGEGGKGEKRALFVQTEPCHAGRLQRSPLAADTRSLSWRGWKRPRWQGAARRCHSSFRGGYFRLFGHARPAGMRTVCATFLAGLQAGVKYGPGGSSLWELCC